MRKTTGPSFEFEERLWEKGYTQIAGIDEAGRGPLAGPVVAASVILPNAACILGLNDSKKLTAIKRELLFSEIVELGQVGVGVVDIQRIDEINILNATKEAMLASVRNMLVQPDYLLIDGTIALLTNIEQEYIISGDARSYSIAAASIIAKVVRDDIMLELHKIMPIYGWNSNKGYGTKAHRDAIKLYGPSQYHRLSFRGVLEYA